MSKVLVVRGQDMIGAAKVALIFASVAAMAAPHVPAKYYTIAVDAKLFLADNTGHEMLHLEDQLKPSDFTDAGMTAAGDYQIVSFVPSDLTGKALGKFEPHVKAIYTVGATPIVPTAAQRVPPTHVGAAPPSHPAPAAAGAVKRMTPAEIQAKIAAEHKAVLAKQTQALAHGGSTGSTEDEKL